MKNLIIDGKPITRTERVEQLERLYSAGNYSMPVSDLAICQLYDAIERMAEPNNPARARPSTVRADNSHWENLVDNSQ